MNALREQQQRGRASYAAARKHLGELTDEVETLRGGWASACIRLLHGEADEAELEEREAELEAVERRVRRAAAAVEALKPPPRLG